MRKDALRKQIREIKRQFTRQQLEELSLPIVARLRERLKDARTVVAYYPLPDEVDIRVLLDELVADGKTVFLPKVVDDETMELRRYTGAQDLREGAFHIMEPIGEKYGDAFDMILVPGLAFDPQGHRLGRGRGYYDRFLRAQGDRNLVHSDCTRFLSPCACIGVCFDFQKVAEVPVDAYDVAMDEVI